MFAYRKETDRRKWTSGEKQRKIFARPLVEKTNVGVKDAEDRKKDLPSARQPYEEIVLARLDRDSPLNSPLYENMYEVGSTSLDRLSRLSIPSHDDVELSPCSSSITSFRIVNSLENASARELPWYLAQRYHLSLPPHSD